MPTPKMKGSPAGTTRTVLRQNESPQFPPPGNARKAEGRTYFLGKSAPKASGQPRLRPPPSCTGNRQRVVPPRRPANLRRGGGRKDIPGWTEQKRKTNRRRLNKLRPLIKTGVTVTCPSRATAVQLKTIEECCRNFCKEKGVAARTVWEGPSPHFHMALGCRFSQTLEAKWRARLGRRWQVIFGQAMPERAFFWKPDEAGQQIASYLSKTRDKNGRIVKGRHTWLTFTPCWEIGFRALIQAMEAGRPPSQARPARQLCQMRTHPVSPRYTIRSLSVPSWLQPRLSECKKAIVAHGSFGPTARPAGRTVASIQGNQAQALRSPAVASKRGLPPA